MRKQVLQLCILALLFAVGCGADKSSNEACLYETTMNLDKGNYDAVLASGCADSMQMGAAYFGKAGYDVTSVINSFSSTGSASAPTSQSDLSVYLTNLTGTVTQSTLDNLNLAKNEYSLITNTSAHYADAQFYLSIVDAVNGLSLLKVVADSTGLGSIDTDCDMNQNSIPDELDAMSCALLSGSGCASGVATTRYGFGPPYGPPNGPLSFSGKSGTYRGMSFTVSGAGDAANCSVSSYQKLVTDSAVALVVTLNPTEGMCTDISTNNSGDWPCPFEQDGVPLDLVTALDQSLTSAISALGSALPAGTIADVQQSITDIKTQACGADGVCSSAELSSYLQSF